MGRYHFSRKLANTYYRMQFGRMRLAKLNLDRAFPRTFLYKVLKMHDVVIAYQIHPYRLFADRCQIPFRTRDNCYIQNVYDTSRKIRAFEYNIVMLH